MFVNKFKINISTIPSGVTATTISFPISMDFQNVDQSELINRVFVENEVENSINPILDYDKVRFLPLTPNGVSVSSIVYDVKLLVNGTYVNNYGNVGFTDDDIKYRKNSFKQTYVNLSLYDSDNALTQNLLGFSTIYSELRTTDLIQNVGNGVLGQPKPAINVPINFVLENPLQNPKGFCEGFHVYDFKDSLKIGESKYLYMRASFKNAKTGKSVNLMVKNTAQPIESLVKELYTRLKLTRTQTGYYYEIDDTYQGNNTTGTNNVAYNNNSVIVSLYEINAT
jgi:hypothetical protein